MYTLQNQVRAVLFGVAVGDALGVPVEFSSRAEIRLNPVTDMTGYGTYHLPPGTWSDDSSLAFCLAEALTREFNLHAIGQYFVDWACKDYWTPYGEVFDIGGTTAQAINRLAAGISPELAGDNDESSNGNGALMRISPLLFHLMGKPAEDRFELTRQVSAITHGHIRSVIACFYYLEFAGQLYEQQDKFEIYRDLQIRVPELLASLSVDPKETAAIDRLIRQNIHEFPEDEIESSGYVIHTLEAAIWCLMTTNNYRDAVLKAVNLGRDTDTTAAVTGGLAGLLYGFNGIPENWVRQLARYDDIEDLAQRLASKLAEKIN